MMINPRSQILTILFFLDPKVLCHVFKSKPGKRDPKYLYFHLGEGLSSPAPAKYRPDAQSRTPTPTPTSDYTNQVPNEEGGGFNIVKI